MDKNKAFNEWYVKYKIPAPLKMNPPSYNMLEDAFNAGIKSVACCGCCVFWESKIDTERCDNKMSPEYKKYKKVDSNCSNYTPRERSS